MSLSPRVARWTASALAERARREPIDDHTVLYESFAGRGMLCNPEAVFRALLADPRYVHLRHVWSLDAPARHPLLLAEFAGHPRVRFVRRRSRDYYRTLGTARYLINNATFPVHFGKRAGQTYLNTWHGTPLKAMGYDVPGGAPDTVNVVRNLLSADYLLAPNDATAGMYLDSYRARNLFAGELITAGTPRIDRQFAGDAAIATTAARLPSTDRRRTVLYAPTWRGSFAAPDLDPVGLQREVMQIERALPADTRLLVRLHQQLAVPAHLDRWWDARLVPADLPANDVLAASAALITDYSSICVDFLATGRPVLHYVPDLDDYRAGRGLAVRDDELPGPLCHDIAELTAALAVALAEPVPIETERYLHARARYCALEDGGATARVVDAVFGGDRAHVARPVRDGRTTLMLHAGRLAPNGITASARSLLHLIDHQRYDVTVTYPVPTTAAGRRAESELDPATRLLPRLGGSTWVKLRETPRGFPRVVPGGPRPPSRRRTERLADEWARCFGAARFDHVIDFSGYSGFQARLLHARPDGTLSVWLHNDIAAELTGARRDRELRNQLQTVVGLYPFADRLVSVSPALHDLNLRRYGVPGRTGYAENLVDAERVRALARAPQPATPAPFAGVTFVTVGRLSAQKNHRRLVAAFAQLHRQEPDTRLVIVGDGPLRAALVADARAAGLSDDDVVFTGALDNPYPVMAAADCFVLSSDYEGQPIVILEARVLELPIVSTAFATVGDALPDGAGLVVDRDVRALADGLLAFRRGAVRAAAFDHDAHNRRALAQFETLVCGAPADRPVQR